jgi:hypothetical protein
MVAFALLTYGFIINQLEWFMTPPRSELWAACLGAAIALGWYILRHKQQGSLRVAILSALGGGIGFSFGNFLQVLGTGSSLPFNFWNIMEYSIGFFGGLGMAYGTLTSSWPVNEQVIDKRNNIIPMLFLVVFIPLVLWDQSFNAEQMDHILKLGGTTETIFWFQTIAIVAIVLGAVILLTRFNRTQQDFSAVKSIFIIYLGLYTFLSFLLTGITVHPIEQYLYLANIAVLLLVMPSLNDNFALTKESPLRWMTATVLCVLLIAILAMVALQSHGELPGSHMRFK